jgi:hypothetical protein
VPQGGTGAEVLESAVNEFAATSVVESWASTVNLARGIATEHSRIGQTAAVDKTVGAEEKDFAKVRVDYVLVAKWFLTVSSFLRPEHGVPASARQPAP